jgi:hypothetical protein
MDKNHISIKSIAGLPKKHRDKIDDISDERNTDEGIWIYLKDEYADFTFDPHQPIRTIHEHTVTECVHALVKNVKKITLEDLEKYPSLTNLRADKLEELKSKLK